MPEEKKETCRIVFTGDIAFSKIFSEGWKNDCLSGEVKAFLSDADHVVANLEGPLTGGGFTLDRDLMHASDPAAGAYLRENGIRIWSLANNHIGDCGADGIEDTLRCAKENGCSVIGAGHDLKSAARPLILGDGVKVGILALAGTRERIRAEEEKAGALTWDREELIQKTLAGLRAEADWVVLVVHGFDEFYDLPSPEQRARYHRYLDWGADVVVGHHPHVVQNYERVGDKLIFYSLGNFVFGTAYQRTFAHTETGVLLAIDFGRDGTSWECLPVHIDCDRGVVERGKLPQVFTEIGENDYRFLWPLEAARHPALERHKNAARYHIYPDRSPLGRAKALYRWFRKLRSRSERRLLRARILGRLGVWRCSPLKTVAAYIREDKSALKKPDKEFAIQEHGARYP